MTSLADMGLPQGLPMIPTQDYVHAAATENAESCAKPPFPPVSAESIAANMLRESIRDGWIMGEHPVRFLRGNDHD